MEEYHTLSIYPPGSTVLESSTVSQLGSLFSTFIRMKTNRKLQPGECGLPLHTSSISVWYAYSFFFMLLLMFSLLLHLFCEMFWGLLIIFVFTYWCSIFLFNLEQFWWKNVPAHTGLKLSDYLLYLQCHLRSKRYLFT